MAQLKVLMTGATGYIAQQILPIFKQRYDMILVDIKDVDRDGNKVPGINVVDLIESDRSKYKGLFEGVNAVVHLAYKRDRGPDSKDHFVAEMENLEMAYNVYRTAYDSGVERVAVASSNHAADWYEYNLIHERKMENLDPYKVPLSDNFYGWAKATYEHMGFLFASGVFGHKLGVVCIRIGAPREIKATKDLTKYKRDLGAYISKRDITQLFTKAIEASGIEDEHGVPWHIVYGISNNTRAFWSLANARCVLNYQPDDDSEVKFAKDINKILVGKETTGRAGRLGSK